jgi:hypothetical protein
MSTVQADYEQMLLGRMSLLFLLRGRHSSMLMLDEPETHFNDSWKREIIDIVDLRRTDSSFWCPVAGSATWSTCRYGRPEYLQRPRFHRHD